MQKKLYRSTNDKIIAGVCGGIAEYVGVDATVVRLIAVLLFFTSVGLIGYIVAMLIMPLPPADYNYYQNGYNSQQRNYYNQSNQGHGNSSNYSQSAQGYSGYHSQPNSGYGEEEAQRQKYYEAESRTTEEKRME